MAAQYHTIKCFTRLSIFMFSTYFKPKTGAWDLVVLELP